MNKLFFSCLCIAVLLCCGACKQSTENKAEQQSENIIPIRFDKPYYVNKFSYLFSKVRYVPLEETPNSILGDITELMVTNNGDFIVFDALCDGVFRFAPDGKFLNKIGVKGRGPNEYVLPWDVEYDPFTNKVLVWDYGTHSILTYALDGKMEHKIKLPWVIEKMGVMDKEHLICYMNHGEFLKEGETAYNYKVIRRDGAIVKEFGEYGAEMNGFCPSKTNVFWRQLGRCLCQPPFSNTLYSVENGTLEPVVTFDFLENNIPEEWKKSPYEDFKQKMKNNLHMIKINQVFETEKYFLLRHNRNGGYVYYTVVEKETKEVRNITHDPINDLYGLAALNDLVNVHNNEAYFLLLPMALPDDLLNSLPEGEEFEEAYKKSIFKTKKRFIEAYGEEAVKIYADSLMSAEIKLHPGEKEFICRMAETSNPILQICTLK